MRADVSDISDPELIRGVDIELSVQGIVGHDSRAATVGARLLFVTNLGPYARQTGQTPSPIGADVFAEITQIVMQLVPLGRLPRNRLPGNGYP